ncbi:MAG: DUF1329 domain-containing protein [Thermodesulfobacteriota bacterium]
MHRSSLVKLTMLLLCLAIFPPAPSVSADVKPGDLIDKDSWEKAEGLLPDPMINWVKRGEMFIDVEDLKFDSSQFFAPPALKSLKENAGKYELDDEHSIIEVSTGNHPTFIEGIPFPAIDANDPKAAAKIIYNSFYYKYSYGNLKYPFGARWIGESGFERLVECNWRVFVMVGYPGAREISNPTGLERQAIIQILAPFDIAGTNVLLWRYIDGRADNTFSYVPAIRRVRRMSPANRSDAFIGTDMAVDDTYGFDGKVGTFTWKLLRKQDALVPYVSNTPQLIVQNDRGEWQTTTDVKEARYGFQEPDKKVAPWVATNLVWVKRAAYLIEASPKDPYYNYGKQYLWADAENFWICFKVIYDRANQYWKTFSVAQMPVESADKTMHWVGTGTHDMVDDRRQHATILDGISTKCQHTYYAIQDQNDYSLGGFQKLCK